MSDTGKKVLTIPREEAVFWLDQEGRWRNRHGRFEKPQISARFHARIRRDEHGYFLTQEHPGYVEKVYFPYEDTALFVSRIKNKPDTRLILNNAEEIPLLPEDLFIEGDKLYILRGEERIKFTENSLMQVSGMMEFSGEESYIRVNGESHKIPEY